MLDAGTWVRRTSEDRQPYRILVVTNMYPHDADPARGAFVQAQVIALQSRGAVVRVLHIRGDQSSFNYAKSVRRVRQDVTKSQVDIVYAFYGLSGWVSLWQPVPVVLSLAGDDILGTPDGRGGLTPKSRISVALSQWAAHRSAVVCVQSDEMRARLWGAGLRKRALVIPYGVDEIRFSPGDQASSRQRLGMPIEDLLVIFPNTPTETRKRFDIAQQAVNLVREQLPNVRLQVVRGVSHAEMPHYYRAADCCLLTSDWEGSPNVVKEALLSGLPVVSTDVGDVRRWIDLSPESIVCSQSPEAVASGISRVLRERRRVDPKPFVSRFGVSAITDRMISIFRGVLSGAEPRETLA